MKNEKSIFSWFGYILPMQQRFEMIKNAGFDSVMLWWSNEFEEIDGDRRKHPGLAGKVGLKIENIHTPYWNANDLWRDGLCGDQYQSLLAACIEDCANFSIPTAVVHLTGGSNPPEFNEIGLNRINQLVDLAEKREVNLAFENLRHPIYLDHLFSRIESDRAGFCYDSGHAHCISDGQGLLTKFGDKLFALHLHDNDGTEDQHRLPYEGNINWNDIMLQIQRTGFKGSISLEVDANNFEDSMREKPEDYLQRAYKAVAKLAEI